MKKAFLAGCVLILLAPFCALMGVVVLFNPAAQASCSPTSTKASGAAPVPETSRVVRPLPDGAGTITSRYGMRRHPITGVWKLHSGLDFAAPASTPILAVADGVVAFAGPATGYGNLILITHTVGSKVVGSGYAHMYSDDVLVSAGNPVTAGQLIARIGSSGYSTGPHLHFEIRAGGASGTTVDPEPWLATHGAIASAVTEETSTTACGAPEATEYAGHDPNALVDDPTSSGQITRRTAHVLAQVQANFPGSAWSCWSPRSGPSEHPLGRACDGTFGNSIGTAASGPALALGWRVTNWLKDNAATLGVDYLIWQGKIWSLARSSEGWRPYDGGGMHDPDDVTGAHRDHSHFSIAN